MLQIQKRNQNWLPEMFDEFFFGDENLMRPSMNIIENEKEYRIQLAAAGFKKEEASVTLNENEIKISLNHKEEHSSSEKYLRREFIQKNYQQSFVIPEDVESGKIQASLENGVLMVTLPKYEKKPENKAARQIEIC